jgi:SAM-dependent methyltransferase
MSDTESLQPPELNPYDVVAYPGSAFLATHPRCLAAIGILHGLEPAPVERCRVLELGCGDGANLVGMAYQLPHARFVGIDLAAAAVQRGRALAAELALDNVQLRVMDILAAATRPDRFDYIIAHGVWSWVPDHVREALLAACAALLEPSGIAFISYLAWPGNQLRDVLRQFLRRADDPAALPAVRIARARELLRALGGSLDSTDYFQQAMRRAARDLGEWPDGSLFHDLLADVNAAERVTDFAARARSHSLAFLGEAEYMAMCWRSDPMLTEARSLLAAAEARGILEKEQLLDELRCRRFRQTLLCRADRVRSSPTPARALRLAAATRLRPVGAVDLDSATIAEFRSPHDVAVRIDHPVAKAALLQLAREAPRLVPGAELLTNAREAAGRLSPDTVAADAEVLGSVLLALAGAGHAELSAWAPPFVLLAGERPRASALARLQLERGPRVTTLLHGMITVEDPLGGALLRLLDGTRSRDQLRAELERLTADGSLAVPGHPGEGTSLRERLAQGLEDSLAGLARLALIEA